MNEDEIAEAIRFWEHTGGGCAEHHDEACEWQQQCDEPGCKKETTSGWKDETGKYRRTCSKHSQWAR